MKMTVRQIWRLEKGDSPWETEISRVGPGGKIGQHTYHISAVQARKAVLTGTDQGYFLDSPFQYLTKYRYAPSTFLDVSLHSPFVFVPRKNPICFPQFQRRFCFASWGGWPCLCTHCQAVQHSLLWGRPDDTERGGFAASQWYQPNRCPLLLKMLRFRNQLSLRNFRAKENFPVVKSFTSAQENKEPLRNLGSSFRIGIVT